MTTAKAVQATGNGSVNDLSYSDAVSHRSAQDEADDAIASAKRAVQTAEKQLKGAKDALAQAVRDRKEIG